MAAPGESANFGKPPKQAFTARRMMASQGLPFGEGCFYFGGGMRRAVCLDDCTGTACSDRQAPPARPRASFMSKGSGAWTRFMG
jgi:hypothetical protein